MAGLGGLKVLLLWAGIIVMAKSPPPPQCSYTVTPIKFGFRIDMIMNSTTGDYTITLNEEDRQSKFIYIFSQSHEIEHLKPCTEYEHSVAFIDAGKATPCNGTANKTMTSGMSKDDIKDVSCMTGYVCYQSDWDISSSLSASNNVPAETCKTDNKMLCIKPGYDDICTDLTTTFRSNCTASFDVTKSITVDFLIASEITQKAPTKLPVKKIDTELPKLPNCKNLTIDYTCQDGKPSNTKKLSELEPFTDYSCTGQIKDNNVAIKNTNAVKFRIDCAITRNTIKSATNTSIKLSWITTSQKCLDLHDLQKFSYDCSCRSSSHQNPIVPAYKERLGGRCQIVGLKPFTYYTCKVQPKYNNKNVPQPATVKQETEAGKPEDIKHDLTLIVLDHNVIRVKCDYRGSFNGPERKFIARLHNAGVTKELRNTTCDFSFKDLSYLTEYNLEVTVHNGKHSSKSKMGRVTTSYNDKAVIGCLVAFFIIIFSVALGVAVYKICVLRRREYRNDVMMLETTAIYVNVPRSEGRH